MDLIKLAHDLREESLIYKNEYKRLLKEFFKLENEAPRGELIADDCLMNQTLEELQLMYRNTFPAINDCQEAFQTLDHLIDCHNKFIDMIKKGAVDKKIIITIKNDDEIEKEVN